MKFSRPDIQMSHLIYGVEIVLTSREQVSFNLLVLRKRRELLEVMEQFENVPEDFLINRLKNKDGIYASLTGRGVLVKKINTYSDSSVEILRQAVPNGQPQDFIVQSTGIDQQVFAGVIRRDWFEPLFTRLFAARVFFESLVIGPFSACVLKQSVYPDQMAFQVAKYRFVYNEGSLTEIAVSDKCREEDLVVGTERFNCASIFPFCSVLAGMTGTLNVSRTDDQLILSMMYEKRQRTRFKKTILAGSAGLLVLLVANFLIQQQIGARHEQLEGEVAENLGKISLIENLTREIKNKKEILAGNYSNGPVHAFIADDIASTLPRGIHLTQLEIFPVIKKIRSGEPITYDSDRVIVQGNSSRSQELNTWIKKLKSLDWVADISIGRYDKSQSTEDGLFNVIIEVKS